ncbi:EF-hand domain-containing protein [Niveispirillum fermenti]|uniref:EF-hand domain-containing protein n=1 Tax=Niveispirillum fermenti TaxID=1233113 RepID=UPI003A8A9E55
MALTLSACGGGGGGKPDRPLPGIRYVPVSPLGEPLGPPGADPAPYRQAMREWFARTDKDGDGKLSLAEIQAEADRVFPLYDLNGDGQITSAELTSYRVSTPFHALPADTGRRLRPGRIDMTPDEAASLTREGKGRPQYRMGIDPVMAADTNADFRVTREELRAEAARRLSMMDRNDDGAITLAEFMEHAEGPMRAWAVQ